MLNWWTAIGIHRVDLLVRRQTGVTIPHQDLSIHDIPLPWLKAENAHGSEIYLRPERGREWPMVFLDDVETGMACRIAQKYTALVVQTSTVGGCHLWIKTTCSLDETGRCHSQRWLAPRAGSDRASISGEHFGRLAGMRNWKRQGEWVNIIQSQRDDLPCWDPTPALQAVEESKKKHLSRSARLAPKREPGMPDQSESGKEWGWVCGMLEHGIPPETVFHRLYQRASIRRGSDAERYSRHTIHRALNRLL